MWTCSSDNCSCWMRNDFSFESQPLCPICQSEMNEGTKLLPVLRS
ncbi:cold-inducible protein YdjO-related protein [Paenibacillus sp. SYP-B4298]